MSKLIWDAQGERFYETGVDHGVLYVWNGSSYGDGVAWNGLTSVAESPSGGEASALYADNIKYLNLMSVEEFGGTIEAYTKPDEFDACDGTASMATGLSLTGQKRAPFAFTYRTKIGNDVDDDLGYKIHIVYGAKVSPTERSHATINDSPEAETLSYTFTTTPIEIETKDGNGKPYKPVAHIVIDSTKFDTTALKAKLQEIEDHLYGRDADSTATPAITALTPTLLTPDDIYGYITDPG